MKVRVKFFASYSELIGKEEEEFRLKKGTTLKTLRELVISAHPLLKNVKHAMLASLNEALVEGEDVELKEGDLVALFPPSSGG